MTFPAALSLSEKCFFDLVMNENVLKIDEELFNAFNKEIRPLNFFVTSKQLSVCFLSVRMKGLATK